MGTLPNTSLDSQNERMEPRWHKSRAVLVQAVEGRRLKLGDTHPHTIESLNNLTNLYDAWKSQKKPTGGEQSLHKLKVLKSGRIHSRPPISGAVLDYPETV